MRVTERLRELFEDMILGEPPLRTTPQATADAGRRLLRRARALWTVAGTALVVAVVAAVPQAWHSRTPNPTGAAAVGSAEPTPRPTALALQPYRVCPSAAHLIEGDAAVLPDPQTAMAALLAAGAQISSELSFIARGADLSTVKLGGVPHVDLVVDVGDGAGYGSLNLQIYPENDVSPAQRAARGANVSSCVDGQRYAFPDGSIALYYPISNDDTVTHVWYFAAGGFTMNIGMFPTASGEQELPARDSMPLATDQVMLLADAIAQAT